MRAGQAVAILEAMKMEHVVVAPIDGRVARIAAIKGEVLNKGQPLMFIAPEAVEAAETDADEQSSISTTSAPTSPRRWSAGISPRTRRVRTRWPAAAIATSARRARTSTTWSIRAPSLSTAPSPWRRSAGAARSRS